MFSVFRNWAVVFQTCCIIFHFHQQCNDPVSPCTSIWCHFFSRSHSVMFDTSILWYFAAVLTCISLVTLNIFSLASLPLCTFFSKISVYIFSPFSNFNACFVYGIVVFISVSACLLLCRNLTFVCVLILCAVNLNSFSKWNLFQTMPLVII